MLHVVAVGARGLRRLPALGAGDARHAAALRLPRLHGAAVVGGRGLRVVVPSRVAHVPRLRNVSKGVLNFTCDQRGMRGHQPNKELLRFP